MRVVPATPAENAPLARHSRVRLWRALGENALAYLYLAPTLLILGTFNFYPVVKALQISLTRWDPRHPVYVGLENYSELLGDEEFWAANGHTLYFVAGTVVPSIVIALGVALLLNVPIAGRGFYRLAYFAPYITTVVAVSMVWAWIFNSRYGLLNYFLTLLHLPTPAWLLDPRWTMPAVIIMSIWKGLGFNVVIFLAGLQNVDRELQEAARVDGAAGWTIFRHITWPLLSPVTFFVAIISVIGAFKVFTEIYVLFGGSGPLRSVSTIVMFVYEKAFREFRLGYAAAASYVLFGLIFIVTLLQFWASRKRVHYS